MAEQLVPIAIAPLLELVRNRVPLTASQRVLVEEWRNGLAEEIFERLDRESLFALAIIGVTALVDEATGYQSERPYDELRRMARDLPVVSP